MTPSTTDENAAGRVTVGLAVPIFLGAIMYDLSNDPGTAAAPSPVWVVPPFVVAGMLVGLLWRAPTRDSTPGLPYSRAIIVVVAGSILFGTLIHPPPEVFYWICAVAISVVAAIVTSWLKSIRKHRREEQRLWRC